MTEIVPPVAPGPPRAKPALECGREAAAFFPPSNGQSLKVFQRRIGRYWRHVLRRRSQRGRITAERMTRLFNRWLIPPRLVHSYPSVRFDAMHPR